MILIKPFKRLTPHRDKISAGEYNRLVSIVERFASSQVSQGIIDSSGIHNRRSVAGAAEESTVRRAITREAATAESYILCNLYDSQGVEIESGAESNIAVHCSIVGDVGMNSAIPTFPDNKDLYVAQFPVSSGDSVVRQWHCLTVLQGYNTTHFEIVSDLFESSLYECV